MNVKLFSLIILCFYLGSAISQDSKTLSPSYLPEKKLSFGGFTLGEKLPKLKETPLTKKQIEYGVNPIFQDSNSYVYELKSHMGFLKSCRSKVRRDNKIYQEFNKVKTDLTSKDYNNLDMKIYKMLIEKDRRFKEFSQPLKDSQPSRIQVFTGDNDEIISIVLSKNYDYIPDHDSIKLAIKKTFGEPSKDYGDTVDAVRLRFDNMINNTKIAQAYSLKTFSKALKSMTTYGFGNVRGPAMSITTSRIANVVMYTSTDYGRLASSYNTFYNECIDTYELELQKLISIEAENNTKKANEFKL